MTKWLKELFTSDGLSTFALVVKYIIFSAILITFSSTVDAIKEGKNSNILLYGVLTLINFYNFFRFLNLEKINLESKYKNEIRRLEIIDSSKESQLRRLYRHIDNNLGQIRRLTEEIEELRRINSSGTLGSVVEQANIQHWSSMRGSYEEPEPMPEPMLSRRSRRYSNRLSTPTESHAVQLPDYLRGVELRDSLSDNPLGRGGMSDILDMASRPLVYLTPDMVRDVMSGPSIFRTPESRGDTDVAQVENLVLPSANTLRPPRVSRDTRENLNDW